MRTGVERCECPLCVGPAQAVELIGLGARQIACPNCTAYQISEGLERILVAIPKAKGRARYLSDAAWRATRDGERLELSEENFLGVAAVEEALQRG